LFKAARQSRDVVQGPDLTPLHMRRFSPLRTNRAEQVSLTTLREKLVKIGARIVRHGRYLVFQLAEVAVPRALLAAILRRIERLRPRPLPA
jgi:hypothetical protein